MAVASNAKKLGDLNARRAKEFLKAAKTETKIFENEVWDTAVDLSSGTDKQATFDLPSGAHASANHPYGHGRSNRRGPRGRIPNGGDAGIVNEQTGKFKASWDTFSSVSTSEIIVVLFNEAPYAKYMYGTRIMIYRPILDRIQARQRTNFLAHCAKARRRALAIT